MVPPVGGRGEPRGAAALPTPRPGEGRVRGKGTVVSLPVLLSFFFPTIGEVLLFLTIQDVSKF